MKNRKPYEDKDTFLTTSYRSGYIHTCRNITRGCDEVSVSLPNGERRTAASIRSAKRIISRAIGGRPVRSYKPER
jgi:hypothetical protein